MTEIILITILVILGVWFLIEMFEDDDDNNNDEWDGLE